jgi:hypothetical protein
MQLLENVLFHGSIFALLFTIYLLALMRGLNPRIWAFSDYPKSITDHVPPQTPRERRVPTLRFLSSSFALAFP